MTLDDFYDTVIEYTMPFKRDNGWNIIFKSGSPVSLAVFMQLTKQYIFEKKYNKGNKIAFLYTCKIDDGNFLDYEQEQSFNMNLDQMFVVAFKYRSESKVIKILDEIKELGLQMNFQYRMIQ